MGNGYSRQDHEYFGRVTDPSELTEVCEAVESPDPMYLFMCHLEWRDRKNLNAYEELVAALDDPNDAIRNVAEHLLSHRISPRPKRAQQRSKTDAGSFD